MKPKQIETQGIMDKHWPKFSTGAEISLSHTNSVDEDFFQECMNKAQIEMIEHYWPGMDKATRQRATESINRLRLA